MDLRFGEPGRECEIGLAVTHVIVISPLHVQGLSLERAVRASGRGAIHWTGTARELPVNEGFDLFRERC